MPMLLQSDLAMYGAHTWPDEAPTSYEGDAPGLPFGALPTCEHHDFMRKTESLSPSKQLVCSPKSAALDASFAYYGYRVSLRNTFLSIEQDRPSDARRRSHSEQPKRSPSGDSRDDVSQMSTSDEHRSHDSFELRSDDSPAESPRGALELAADDETAPDAAVEAIIEGKCTTLMVHGVPNRLMCDELLPIFHQLGFEADQFDYMYMPLDNRAINGMKKKSNLGYIFINCLTTEVAAQFTRAIYNHQFSSRRSTKPVHATLASSQGVAMNLQLLINSWRKTKRLRKSRANCAWLRVNDQWQAVPVEKLRLHQPGLGLGLDAEAMTNGTSTWP